MFDWGVEHLFLALLVAHDVVEGQAAFSGGWKQRTSLAEFVSFSYLASFSSEKDL